jgi:CRISPR-associated protein Csd2
MMARPDALQRRHEFVLLFDVTNGNPNGDPDAGNMPRMDPETGHGLVSDVCLKRKVRNYVEMTRSDAPQYRIYVTEGAVLNDKHREAYAALRPADASVMTERKLNPKSDEEAARLRDFMCANFFDIRSFGAVLSTGINAGQVRGPVQIGFARSIEPVLPLEVSITRMAATNETERKERVEGEDDQKKRGDKRTMGRKHIIPYGLYRAHGYVSAPLAYDDRKGTGFRDVDLDLLFEALGSMFEHDRSAARGEMTTRKLVVFRHAGALGNARAQALFDRVQVLRNHDGALHPPGAEALNNAGPARGFADYTVEIDRRNLPEGIGLLELI